MNQGYLGLNPQQRQAAEHHFGPLLILAGAGTGKTKVITTRIAGMLHEGIPAEQILAVTFTNKAAAEMQERVAAMVDAKMAKDLTLCTFHSLCVRLLRSSIERLGYKRNFSIYTQSDQIGLLKQIIVRKAAKNESLDAKAANSLISAAKNMGKPVSDNETSLISEVYRTYQAELKQYNAVDFDDLLILAVRALKEHADVRETWRGRFRFIMVDEFQDTNHLQMELLRHIVGPEQNICVVGDDDQSIYGWRGADITNILEFERFFPEPAVVKLEENYRSCNRILRLANSVIRHNRNRREKTLWSSHGEGEITRIVAMPDAETEAEWVATEVLECQKLERRNWEDFAILFRTNTQSRIMEQMLRERGIPYRVIGGQSFYERREIKDVLSYLSLLVNPDDDVALLRVINTPPRGIGSGTVELATQFSIQHHLSIFDAFQNEAFLNSCAVRSRKAIEAFVQFVHGYADIANSRTGNYATMTEEILREVEYDEFLKRGCKDEKEAVSRRSNVDEFIQSLYDHVANGRKGLRKFLDSCSLMQDRESDKERGQGVSLITMHAAKGLEFPVCHIIGLEEGILPHARSVEEGSRDEERRLLYVAITRAKLRLTISWCQSRKRWGDMIPCMPSSFIKEMDKREIEQIHYQTLADQPVHEDVAADLLADFRAKYG